MIPRRRVRRSLADWTKRINYRVIFEFFNGHDYSRHMLVESHATHKSK